MEGLQCRRVVLEVKGIRTPVNRETLLRELSCKRITLEASVGHELEVEAGRQVSRLGRSKGQVMRLTWHSSRGSGKSK